MAGPTLPCIVATAPATRVDRAGNGTSTMIPAARLGHDIPSRIVKAGRRLDLHLRPADFDAIRTRALERG